MNGRKWTTKDDNYLIKNYKKLTIKKLAFVLNRTETAVRRHATSLGIIEKQIQRKWTKEEEEFLNNNYMCMSYKELAEALGRGYYSITRKLERMRLIRTEPHVQVDPKCYSSKPDYLREVMKVASYIWDKRKKNI